MSLTTYPTCTLKHTEDTSEICLTQCSYTTTRTEGRKYRRPSPVLSLDDQDKISLGESHAPLLFRLKSMFMFIDSLGISLSNIYAQTLCLLIGLPLSIYRSSAHCLVQLDVHQQKRGMHAYICLSYTSEIKDTFDTVTGFLSLPNIYAWTLGSLTPYRLWPWDTHMHTGLSSQGKNNYILCFSVLAFRLFTVTCIPFSFHLLIQRATGPVTFLQLQVLVLRTLAH